MAETSYSPSLSFILAFWRQNHLYLFAEHRLKTICHVTQPDLREKYNGSRPRLLSSFPGRGARIFQSDFQPPLLLPQCNVSRMVPRGTRLPAYTQVEKPHLIKYQSKACVTFGKIDPDEAYRVFKLPDPS